MSFHHRFGGNRPPRPCTGLGILLVDKLMDIEYQRRFGSGAMKGGLHAAADDIQKRVGVTPANPLETQPNAALSPTAQIIKAVHARRDPAIITKMVNEALIHLEEQHHDERN